MGSHISLSDNSNNQQQIAPSNALIEKRDVITIDSDDDSIVSIEAPVVNHETKVETSNADATYHPSDWSRLGCYLYLRTPQLRWDDPAAIPLVNERSGWATDNLLYIFWYMMTEVHGSTLKRKRGNRSPSILFVSIDVVRTGLNRLRNGEETGFDWLYYYHYNVIKKNATREKSHLYMCDYELWPASDDTHWYLYVYHRDTKQLCCIESAGFVNETLDNGIQELCGAESCVHVEMPSNLRQTNTADCGFWVCWYAEIMTTLQIPLTSLDMVMYGLNESFILKEWIRKQLNSSKAPVDIRNYVYDELIKFMRITENYKQADPILNRRR